MKEILPIATPNDLDYIPTGTPEQCLGAIGADEAARRAGAEVIAYAGSDHGHGIEVDIPRGKAMKSTSVYPEVLEADVIITVPKAKHHSGTGLTLGMKNFIGVTTYMSKIHQYDLNQAIADLNTLVLPSLSVIDASLILLENGPGGPGVRSG